MSKQGIDIRQVLEAALKGLEESAINVAPPAPLIVDGSASSENSEVGAPVIVIVSGASKAHSQHNAHQTVREDAQEKTTLNFPISHPERKHSHPGLERFTIGADLQPSVPKCCFMEPGRPCVNSGACEMRGF